MATKRKSGGRPPNPTPPDKVGPEPGEADQPIGLGTATADLRTQTVRRSYSYTSWNYEGCKYFDNYQYISAEEKRLILTDPHVSASLRVRRAAVMSDGIQIWPNATVDEEDEKGLNRAREVARFCRYILGNVRGGLYRPSLQLQACDWNGHMACELVYRDQEAGAYKGKRVLDSLVPLSHRDYIAWLRNGKLLGLQPSYWPLNQDDPFANRVIPAEKFAVLPFWPDPDHILGTSLVEVVRNPWYKKNQAHALGLANLTQFGSPSIRAKASASAQRKVPLLSDQKDGYGRYIPLKDMAGNVIEVESSEAMQVGVEGFQGGGSAITIPNDAELDLMQAQGDGRIFTNWQDAENKEIWVAVIGTPLMTLPSEYGSNASSQTGSEAAANPISEGKFATAEMYRDVLQRAISYNYPAGYEYDYLPEVTCGNPRQPVLDAFFKALLPSATWDRNTMDDLARQVGVRGPSQKFDPNLPAGTVPGSAPPGKTVPPAKDGSGQGN